MSTDEFLFIQFRKKNRHFAEKYHAVMRVIAV